MTDETYIAFIYPKKDAAELLAGNRSVEAIGKRFESKKYAEHWALALSRSEEAKDNALDVFVGKVEDGRLTRLWEYDSDDSSSDESEDVEDRDDNPIRATKRSKHHLRNLKDRGDGYANTRDMTKEEWKEWASSMRRQIIEETGGYTYEENEERIRKYGARGRS